MIRTLCLLLSRSHLLYKLPSHSHGFHHQYTTFSHKTNKPDQKLSSSSIISMALTKSIVLLVVAVTWLAAPTTTTATRNVAAVKPGFNLAERIKTSGETVDCWSALLELKSCSNEIVLFFLNGQTDIGPDCCRSIGIITRNCWPAMLTYIGFTAEEGNILRGYCDAVSSAAGPSQPPSTSVTQSKPSLQA